MIYSSKKQEEFFQPHRIQVIYHDRSSGYSWGTHIISYLVILRDITKQGEDAILDTWNRYQRCWESETESDSTERLCNFDSKRKAMDQAKFLAIELDYPFDLQRDIVPRDELFSGPIQHCVACQSEMDRGFKPVLCQTCKDDIKRGVAVRESGNLSPVAIEPDNVTGLSFFTRRRLGELVPSLEKVLLLLTGHPCESSYNNPTQANVVSFISAPWQMKQIKIRMEWTSSWKIIHLAPDQVTGLEQLAILFDAVRKDSFADGQSRGESLLVKMANGGLTVAELEDTSVRKSNG